MWSVHWDEMPTVDELTWFLAHDITPLLCRYQLSRQVPNIQLLPRSAASSSFL
jgi:hypothetical protein